MTTKEPETAIQPDLQIDIRGQHCPMHVLRLKQAMKQLEQGQVLSILTAVPGASTDFTSYCKQTGDVLIKVLEQAEFSEYHIRKNIHN